LKIPIARRAALASDSFMIELREMLRGSRRKSNTPFPYREGFHYFSEELDIEGMALNRRKSNQAL
jgi:hypothetical protein